MTCFSSIFLLVLTPRLCFLLGPYHHRLPVSVRMQPYQVPHHASSLSLTDAPLCLGGHRACVQSADGAHGFPHGDLPVDVVLLRYGERQRLDGGPETGHHHYHSPGLHLDTTCSPVFVPCSGRGRGHRIQCQTVDRGCIHPAIRPHHFHYTGCQPGQFRLFQSKLERRGVSAIDCERRKFSQFQPPGSLFFRRHLGRVQLRECRHDQCQY